MHEYIRRIIDRRNALGWSQQRLAEELQLRGLDVSRSVVNNIERGDRRLDPSDLPYFAAALGVDPNYLVGWEEFRKQQGG